MNYLDYVLEKSEGALFVRLPIYASLVGCGLQTARNQLAKGTFPLQVVKLGRTVAVKAVDLAEFLETGQATACTKDVPRSPGRPRTRKY